MPLQTSPTALSPSLPGTDTWRTSLVRALDGLPLRVRRSIIIAYDFSVAGLSFPVAAWLRLGSLSGDEALWAVQIWAVPFFLVLFGAAFMAFGLHRAMWRYASLWDLFNIICLSAVSVGALHLVIFLVQRLEGVPRSLPILQWGVLVFLLGGSRLVYRLLREGDFALALRWRREKAYRHPLLLVGIDPTTPNLIRTLNGRTRGLYGIVGVLCDERDEIGNRNIGGVPVLGTTRDLEHVVTALTRRHGRPVQLLIASSFPPRKVAVIVEQARRLGIELYRTADPLAFRAVGSDALVELRPVALEDLLERPQIALDRAAVGRFIEGRRILVTGAGGSIGSELVRQIAAYQPALLALLDHGEYNLFNIQHEMQTLYSDIPLHAVLCDVRDRGRLEKVFEDISPEIVFHAAALKHVPLVELNPREGVLTNVIGTRHVADLCVTNRVYAMVLISTDKAVNPVNVMGATKRLAELYCQALDWHPSESTTAWPRFITVRFGNVLGSSGSVIPLFQKQLERGGPLTVTHPDIERFFMTVPEAVGLILRAMAYGLEHAEERGRIFVLDMGRPVKIVDIARKMIRLAGLEPDRDVRIVFTGLRPGEKLHEELFDRTERCVKRTSDGLQIAVSPPRRVDELRCMVDRLAQACRHAPAFEIAALLQQALPEYARTRTSSAA